MSDQARRGRTIIIAIIAWTLLIDILTLILAMGANGSQLLIILALLILDVVFFFFLYLGKSWARSAVGILSIFMGLFGWWIVFFIRSLNLAGILVFLCLGASFLGAAGLLFFSPDIRAYLTYRSAGGTPA